MVDERWLALERLATLDSGRRAPWFGQGTRQVWPRLREPAAQRSVEAVKAVGMRRMMRALIRWRALQILAGKVLAGELEQERFVRLVRVILEMTG